MLPLKEKHLRLLVLFFMSRVFAFVPPHRNLIEEESWQPVNEYRRQRKLKYGYEPRAVHPELCRFANEAACQGMDESFQTHSEHGRKLVQSGELKILVLLLQWSDHGSRNLIDPFDMDILWNADMRSDAAPSGSISSYLRINSYGNFQIDADIVPWQISENTEGYHANGNVGLPSGTDIRLAVVPILERMDQQGFNWTEYDRDLDGFIDSMVILHSGYPAELGGMECDDGPFVSNRIWSHSLGPRTDSWKSSTHNVTMGGYMITSAYSGTCGEQIAKIGVIAHELLHSLGLPFLYDLDGPLNSGGGVGGVGSYDIMSNPYGPKDDAAYPGHLSPWSKMQMGWLIPTELEYDGMHVARASEIEPQAYKISKGYQEGEYLLIENRNPIMYDADMWSPGGILIWHIDDHVNVPFAGNRNRGFPGQTPQNDWEPPFPRNGRHYQVALLQADGLYELEKAINNGDKDDFWTQGKTLLPGDDENHIYPNSDGYNFGEVVRTGISIKSFSRSGTIMFFEVSGLGGHPTNKVTTSSAAAGGSETWTINEEGNIVEEATGIEISVASDNEQPALEEWIDSNDIFKSSADLRPRRWLLRSLPVFTIMAHII